MSGNRCPGCGVRPGEWHVLGCDVEQCPYCGGQLLGCEWEGGGPVPLDDRVRWSGWWPGEEECREYGWFARLTRGGWRRCRSDAPGAFPDLNRLRREAVWDREEKRFVRRR